MMWFCSHAFEQPSLPLNSLIACGLQACYVSGMEHDVEQARNKSSKVVIVIKAIIVLAIIALFLMVLILSVGKGT
jgi:hypothetical protein